jgi:hypothetical protein
MSKPCAVCGGPVNPHDEGTWKQVLGWVHGKRKDGMTLREDTGQYAHDPCIAKMRSGQAPAQPDLFDSTTDSPPSVDRSVEILAWLEERDDRS